jgi:hypothetical protein
MSDPFEEERERIMRIAEQRPCPCMVCDDPAVVGIGSWVPDAKYRLAAGGNTNKTPVFAFWLCEVHIEGTAENQKLIRQAVLRSVRTNKYRS